MIYTNIKQVLRQRGRHYEVIAPELKEFFSPHGDYHWHYRDLDTLTNSSGGNCWNWKQMTIDNQSVVEISFQFATKDEEPVHISLNLFKQVVKTLGDSRNLL